VTTSAPTRSPRLLLAACAGLAVTAALLWGASALVWYRVTPAGHAPVEFRGAQMAPSLTGVALVALAGVAGLVATGGMVRRVVAGLLGVAGVAMAWTGVRALTRTAATIDGAPASLPAPGGPPALAITPAPLLAVAGGVVLLAVGAYVVLREPRLSRLGARYAAPGKRPAPVDPDRAAWQDLDAGRDPTVDLPADPPAGPRDGARVDPGDGSRTGPL
jgi:hypothetical protein